LRKKREDNNDDGSIGTKRWNQGAQNRKKRVRNTYDRLRKAISTILLPRKKRGKE